MPKFDKVNENSYLNIFSRSLPMLGGALFRLFQFQLHSEIHV